MKGKEEFVPLKQNVHPAAGDWRRCFEGAGLQVMAVGNDYLWSGTDYARTPRTEIKKGNILSKIVNDKKVVHIKLRTTKTSDFK